MAIRLQNFSPIDRDTDIYEIVDDENNVILDIATSETGAFEITVSPREEATTLPLDDVLRLIGEARKLLEVE